MNRKVRITFTDIDKTNPYTYCSISESCWQREFERWERSDTKIPIMSYSGGVGFGRGTQIGCVHAAKLEYPTLVFEGELFTDDPSVLGNGFDFSIKNELKTENFSFADLEPSYCIVSMQIAELIPSPVPIYNCVVTKLEDSQSCDHCITKCDSCSESFEPFEYIVKYRDKYYHENCFFTLAMEILQAASIHLDSKAQIDDGPEDPIFELE